SGPHGTRGSTGRPRRFSADSAWGLREVRDDITGGQAHPGHSAGVGGWEGSLSAGCVVAAIRAGCTGSAPGRCAGPWHRRGSTRPGREQEVNIVTTRFGVVQVSESEIIRIPEGLVGFRGYTQFVQLSDVEVAGLSWL